MNDRWCSDREARTDDSGRWVSWIEVISDTVHESPVVVLIRSRLAGVNLFARLMCSSLDYTDAITIAGRSGHARPGSGIVLLNPCTERAADPVSDQPWDQSGHPTISKYLYLVCPRKVLLIDRRASQNCHPKLTWRGSPHRSTSFYNCDSGFFRIVNCDSKCLQTFSKL